MTPEVGLRPWSRRCLVAVLPAWVVSRVLVLGALGVAHLLAKPGRFHGVATAARVRQGLLAWDGGWYFTIADHGYAVAGRESLRFFPLYPLVARLVSQLTGIGQGPSLVLLANVAALAALAVLWCLVAGDLGDVGLAQRTVWLCAVVPAGYCTVLAYADSVLLLAVVATFWLIRSGRWWWAVLPGVAAGAVRPLGILLIVPIGIQWWLDRPRPKSVAPWFSRAAVLLSPLVGAGVYLAWVGSTYGNFWLPYSLQEQSGHRGGLTVPVAALWHDMVNGAHGHHLGSALHLPWVIVAVILVIVAWRRLPVPYAAYATVVVAAALSSSNLDSFERYAFGAFPMALAAATLLRRPTLFRFVVAGLAAVMTGYAVLAFLDLVVP